MRFNLFSLVYASILIFGSSLFTVKALASIPNRNPSAMVRVHLLENLDEPSLRQVMKILKDRGFNPVRSPIFSESDTAIVVTKAIPTEDQGPSLKVEVVHKNPNSLPKTFALKEKNSGNIQDVAGLLPADPSALAEATALVDVAAK